MKRKEQLPEPLATFERRLHAKPPVIPAEHRIPRKSPEFIVAREAAVEATATWDRTDPFAGARMRLHLNRGLEDPLSIIEEMKQRQLARKAARRFEEKRHVEEA